MNIRKSLYDYVTVPLIKDFLRDNSIEHKSTLTKPDLINVIELEVVKGSIPSDVVNQWINDVVDLGAKHVYFSEVYKSEGYIPFDKTEKAGFYNTFIGSNKIQEIYRKVELVGDEIVYIFGLGVQYYYETKTNGVRSYYLPVRVVFHSEKSHLFISYRANVRLYKSNQLRTEDKVTETKLLKEINEFIEQNYKLFSFKDNNHKDKLRRAVYKILEESSKLPDNIYRILDSYDKNELRVFIENFKSNYEIGVRFDAQLEEDLMNILEKYICLNWDNQKDFTDGLKCYPFNIALKDSENTTLIQKSSISESLLIKSAYHDNKKRLRQEKMCDSVHMVYTLSSKFKVDYAVEKYRGKISFEKFLTKEEMDEIINNFVQKYYEK